MQAPRFEGSLLASLSELKAIEQQRVADERAQVLRAEAIRIQDLADTERRGREAEEARVRADHDAKLAVERMRLEGEREARLRVEAAELAERARQRMALEEARSAQELELRRAEVAKQRPTWMLAVTGCAVVLAGVLVWFTLGAKGASDEAEQARIAADRRAEIAKRQADDSRLALEGVERDVKDLDGKVAAAIKRLELAKDKAAIDAANRDLKKLAEDRAAAARRVEAARIEAARRLREEGHHMSGDCLNNSLCRPGK